MYICKRLHFSVTCFIRSVNFLTSVLEKSQVRASIPSLFYPGVRTTGEEERIQTPTLYFINNLCHLRSL